MVKIRRACEKDIPAVIRLLEQVLAIHAEIRPDIFIPDTAKYTREELIAKFGNDQTPVFVACDEQDEVKGYVFCALQKPAHTGNMCDILTLYIDDLCVDENARGMHVGTALFSFVKDYARELGCHNITLNVWEGNDSARRFYDAMGFGIQKTLMEMIIE